jgi:multidrug efflux pump subunit AcrB
VAHTLEAELKRVPGTREVQTIGGPGRAVNVALDPSRLRERGVDVMSLKASLQAANQGMPAGAVVQPQGNQLLTVETGQFLRNADEVGDIVVGVHAGKPVYLREVAQITPGAAQPSHLVWYTPGSAPLSPEESASAPAGQVYPALTITVTKKPGQNAVDVARAARARVDELRNAVIPDGVEVSISRDYGETAAEKANKLIQKLMFATGSVVLLVGIALGRREAIIVGSAVILTLTVTLFASWAWGFTLNRVSLFALIFSIGILVDDAIVVVENIHRHQALDPKPLREIIPAAVDEVGGPTILATLTVIAALLPMAFVSGLMGPYMSPIPINSSLGMALSLAIAFTVTPWLALKLMKSHAGEGGRQPHTPSGAAGVGARLGNFFAALLAPAAKRQEALDAAGRHRGGPDAVGGPDGGRVGGAEDAALRQQVGVPGHRRHAGGHAAGGHRRDAAGPGRLPGPPGRGARPAGLCRHGQPHHLQRPGAPVLPAQRGRPGRPAGQPGGQAPPLGEEPRHRPAPAPRPGEDRRRPRRAHPGGGGAARPAGLSPLVAEVYGPDEAGRQAVAAKVAQAFHATPDIVGIDTTLKEDAPRAFLRVNRQRAESAGIAVATIAQTVQAALSGTDAAYLHTGHDKYPVPVRLQLPRDSQIGLDALLALPLKAANGQLVPLSELVRVEQGVIDKPLYTRTCTGQLRLRRHGRQARFAAVRPVRHPPHLKDAVPAGHGTLGEYWIHQPSDPFTQYAIKWDGEWQITYETFRDMGAAYAVGLILIYLLVVAQFKSYGTPLIIMAPIPLTIIGVMPGHALLGAQFTATSMIGMIALAGIIVRNSILLVDFIELQLAQGVPFQTAVIESARVRAQPIALTALAAMIGAFFILDDPIFNGLASR